MIYDDSGHGSLDWIDLRAMSVKVTRSDTGSDNGSGTYRDVEKMDILDGVTGTRVADQTLNGRAVDVYKASWKIASTGQSLIYDVRVYVDHVSSLRVREEYSRNGSIVRTVDNELVAETPALEESLQTSDLPKEASELWKERVATLDTLDYPVLGLPAGYMGLRLRNIIPGPDWRYVRLEYEPLNEPGKLVLNITTLDLGKNPDYSQKLLTPLNEAKAQGAAAGVAISFKSGNTGVQVGVINLKGADVKSIAGMLTTLHSASIRTEWSQY
jgi:hypothetical protein